MLKRPEAVRNHAMRTSLDVTFAFDQSNDEPSSE